MKKFKYPRVVKFLDECLIFGIKPSLVRIQKILELLNSPQKKVNFIHIVGTNGKTSTTVAVSNILYGHGIKCGYHISPHINEYTERMWICGRQVSKESFAEVFNEIYPYVEEVNKLDLEGPMTQFEILAAMAFRLAEDEKLQVMVLEAGMGGRWDATNAADSKVVGFTGVSLEHTSILGKTISEIAIEKAQVIKRNSSVAALSTDYKVISILQDKTAKTNSKLFLYGKDFSVIRKERTNLSGWEVDIKGLKSKYLNLKIPLNGNYQPLNLALSIAVSELYLEIAGRKIEEKLLKNALNKIKVLGRFEIIKKNPLVVADTSHNPEGIKNFVQNLKDNFANLQKIIIFAVLKDKDYKKMISYIAPQSDILILTSSGTGRSLDIDSLENEVYKLKKIPKEIYKVDNIKNSLNFALNISKSNGIICITGSITNLEHIV
jgi:dihydrofolate synthase/folylpolyglutamate synthase